MQLEECRCARRWVARYPKAGGAEYAAVLQCVAEGSMGVAATGVAGMGHCKRSLGAVVLMRHCCKLHRLYR